MTAPPLASFTESVSDASGVVPPTAAPNVAVPALQLTPSEEFPLSVPPKVIAAVLEVRFRFPARVTGSL